MSPVSSIIKVSIVLHVNWNREVILVLQRTSAARPWELSWTSLSYSVLLLVCLHLLLPPVFFLTLCPESFPPLIAAVYSWFLSRSFGAQLTSITPVAWLYLMTFQLQLSLTPSSLLISQFRSQRVWIYVGRAFWPSSLMDQWPLCGPDTQILAPP